MFALAGLLAGTFLVIRRSRTWIYRLEYTYPEHFREQLPAELARDTFFVACETIRLRNFTTSIADTLQSRGYRCGELKVYSKENLDRASLERYFDDRYKKSAISVYNIRFEKKNMRIQLILIYAVLGIFCGIIVRSFLAARASTKARARDVK